MPRRFVDPARVPRPTAPAVAVDLPARLLLSTADWLAREIPEPDYLMGQVVSTTSRAILVAPTGLGKTNFAMAMAIAASNGQDFLHWKCPRPSRCLYIDGEMSKRLLKQRIVDAVRRAGRIPGELFFLSRDEMENMNPLDTIEGQAFVDEAIRRIGGADFLVADNIQSLISGDMKEEEGWANTLPWVKSLTRRGIGQLWIHHTGHDETKAYGTSTRQWQMDTVILLKRAERPDADIAFDMSFKKARERTPENRADFHDATVTLANDLWSVQLSPEMKPERRLSGTARHALDILNDVLSREGQIPPACSHVPANTPCVSEKAWRRDFLAKRTGADNDADTQRKAFRRAADKLIELRLAGKWQELVWLIR